MSLLYLILLTYGLCFLAADARIFGIDTTLYCSVINRGCSHEEAVLLNEDVGVVPLRQRFLRIGFIRDHLSCYFCMGVWAGPLANYFLIQTHQHTNGDYFLSHSGTAVGWIWTSVVAFLIGAVGSYVLNIILIRLDADAEKE